MTLANLDINIKVNIKVNVAEINVNIKIKVNASYFPAHYTFCALFKNYTFSLVLKVLFHMII